MRKWLGQVMRGLVVLGSTTLYAVADPPPGVTRESLSPFMNAIPPSRDYFCVGNGPSSQILHPDRAPYTELAQQDGVVLFSGTAPQQGLNFTLTAGDLVYRNQMSTLGGPEPPPQAGAAGRLQEKSWQFPFPWTEARWHPGEDITWYGYRADSTWIDGLPYWDYEYNSDDYQAICDGHAMGSTLMGPAPHRPALADSGDLSTLGLSSAINLQLSRGIYQASKIRAEVGWTLFPDECPWEFREPWLQARGREPAFNVAFDEGPRPYDETYGILDLRLAKDFFPNYLSIYPFRSLELDGGRLTVGFERSATWPRDSRITASTEVSGAAIASGIRDEFDNHVVFDRVPKYSWETDYKAPTKPGLVSNDDTTFGSADFPPGYSAVPQSRRLPHKRLRTVQLFSGDEARKEQNGVPQWVVAFVYEHPESDRVSATETPDRAVGTSG